METPGTFEISVFEGNAKYRTSGDLGGVEMPFGDGTVEDYEFYNELSATALNAYASGSGNIIDAPLHAEVWVSGDYAPVSVWTETDPGADFSTSPDFPNDTTVETAAKVRIADGTLDLSKYSSGTVYFIFGTAASDTSVSVTLSGAKQTDLDADTGILSGAHRIWVSDFAFTTDNGAYTTLTYQYLNADNDESPGSHGRFVGIVVDATAIR